MIIGIDPGPTRSAWLRYDGHKPCEWGFEQNEHIESWLRRAEPEFGRHLAIEMCQPFGPKQRIGQTILDTCVWIGRFHGAFRWESHLILRKTIVTHVCLAPQANDSQVRRCLIGRYGGDETALGTKHRPGPLRGITSHVWQAFAVAVTYHETVYNEEQLRRQV